MLSKALGFVVSIVLENEEVKKFPKDFVTESTKWIRSWFLIDDPKIEAKINDPTRTAESKKTVIEGKLEDLLENPVFKQELAARLQAADAHRERAKNVLDKSEIDVKGSVYIGDKGNPTDGQYDQKNIVKNSTIKAGGDFRLGDDVVVGNQTINHYYGAVPKDDTKAAAASLLKSELRKLIAKGKVAEAIERFLDAIENTQPDLHNDLLALSGRLSQLERKERGGLLSNQDATTERNRINNAALGFLNELEE